MAFGFVQIFDNRNAKCYFEAQMKLRDVVIGFVFLVILIAGTLWINKTKSVVNTGGPIPTPNIVSRINTAFPNLNIPDGVERANLSDVNGGDNVGVATRTEIVANLPTLDGGKYYQAGLVNDKGDRVLLGSLKVSKSGWILSYDSTKYPGYNKVIVTQGSTSILEGSF